jgi:hypothetical protein
MLEQCVDLLHQQDKTVLAAPLLAALDTTPLPTPPDHRGPEATRMYLLPFASEPGSNAVHGDAILAALEQAQEQGLVTSQTTQRGLGGFISAWLEYVQAQRVHQTPTVLQTCKK